MNRFAKYSWGLPGWNMLVILWGAIVRAMHHPITAILLARVTFSHPELEEL